MVRGRRLAVSTRPLLETHDLGLYSVVVREGDVRSLYWVGVGSRPGAGRPLINVIRIATQATLYSGCDQYATFATAVKIRKQLGPQRHALVEVEPPYKTDADGAVLPGQFPDGEERECPDLALVGWNYKHGFVQSYVKTVCRPTLAPRAPVIRLDGTLGSVPLRVAPPDSD